MSDLPISNKYIASFKEHKRKNKRKSILTIFMIMLVSSILSFILVDYSFPIAIDKLGFRINYYLLIIGIAWQTISLLSPNHHIPMLAAIPPHRRKPLFGKNLTRIKEHHPRAITPLLHPTIMGHLIVWISILPGSILSSILLPGEVRKWKTILDKYAGISLSIGATIYIIFSYIAIYWDLTLLTINIINALIIGLSIPGIAAFFYQIGSILTPNKGTPEKTIIGSISLFILWIVVIMLHFPFLERILFGMIFRLAAGFWIILLLHEFNTRYSMHKI